MKTEIESGTHLINPPHPHPLPRGERTKVRVNPINEVSFSKLKGEYKGVVNLLASILLLSLTVAFCFLPLTSFVSAEEKTIGAPVISTPTSIWKDLPKYIVPTGGWETAISTGRQMYWDGSNWWVRITTDDPAAPIEGNEYSYRYVVQEDANFILEQTTVDHKITIPLFTATETVTVLRVNDNFGSPSTPAPPTNVTASRPRSECSEQAVTITWTEPKFATKVGSNPLSALNSSIVQEMSIRDLLLYQVWRSTADVDANSSSASYVHAGSVLSTENQFIDSNATAGVTYYYVIRSRDAYEPPDYSLFTQRVAPTSVVPVQIILTVDVSKVSGNSSAVFVTVKIPGEAKNILSHAPLQSNGDGTWSVSFIDQKVVTGKKIQYRYHRTMTSGVESEPDQANTSSKEHEFMLDDSKPQMDTSACPYQLKIKDRWGVPSFDETPKGLPLLIASISISSGVTEPGIGKGDAIGLGMDAKSEEKVHNHGGQSLSCPGALTWYSVTSTGPFIAIPNPALPDIKVYFGTSSESGSKMWDVSQSTDPGYTVVLSTVSGVGVPVFPCKAFGEQVARLFVKSANSSYKFQPVDAGGKTTGNASEAIKTGEEFPKWVDISTTVKFTNSLKLKNGQQTGEIMMSWTGPTSIASYGVAHHYDVRFATFSIDSMAAFKMAKMVGRLEAGMAGASESFATINLGDSSPGYHFAVVPIYDDWSSATGAKVVIQFGRMGVAPKLLNINSKPKERAERRVIKGVSGPIALGRANVKADSAEADLRAGLEVPRGGLELSKAVAAVKNAWETWDDETARARIEKANEEAKTSTRKISGALGAMNLSGNSAVNSSIVSFEISDLAGNYYFNTEEKTAKLPLKISVPIPNTWDTNRNGIVDLSEGSEKPILVKDLRVYRLNTKGNFWELVNEGEQTVDLANGVVRAEVKRLSTFALFSPGGAKKDLRELVVYPNPFVPFDEDCDNGFPFGESCGGKLADKSGIAFDNLTENSEIFIYTLSMDIVRRHKLSGATIEEKTGKWRWDGKNEEGESVASGLYIYMVKDDNASGVTKKTGKLVIVR